jgi:mRNA-degrading endonuclease RelE of RelBE toxin-antitoxin system
MPWAIGYQNQNRFTKDLKTLQDAEDKKFIRWLAQVPTHGPQQASELEHVQLKKLGGGTNQWELVVGAKARIQMIINSQTKNVELTGVGHL